MQKEIDDLKTWRKDDVDPKIDKLIAFQRWVLSGATVIGATFGFFADYLKKHLGLGG